MNDIYMVSYDLYTESSLKYEKGLKRGLFQSDMVSCDYMIFMSKTVTVP